MKAWKRRGLIGDILLLPHLSGCFRGILCLVEGEGRVMLVFSFFFDYDYASRDGWFMLDKGLYICTRGRGTRTEI